LQRKRKDRHKQLELFQVLPGDLAARGAQDLLAYRFLSLAKRKRMVPIDSRAAAINIYPC
jgi:plasmid replication initiation protein